MEEMPPSRPQQLTMDLELEPAPVRVRRPRPPAARPEPSPADPKRRIQATTARPTRRPATNRPVRGEPDVPAFAGTPDWRIEPAARSTGVSGVARARAALAASGGGTSDPAREHAA